MKGIVNTQSDVAAGKPICGKVADSLLSPRNELGITGVACEFLCHRKYNHAFLEERPSRTTTCHVAMLQVRPIANASKSIRIPTIRASSSATSRNTSASAPFPTASRCPSPTCACAETPSGLDIDREKNLNGSMAPYAQHVVISTGKSDWTSRIEDDGQGIPWGDFGRQLKAMLGRGGKYSDVRGYVPLLLHAGSRERCLCHDKSLLNGD